MDVASVARNEGGATFSEERNPFLSHVMNRLRARRPYLPADRPYYVRVDRAANQTFAQLWFMTRGCTWDRQGACTMCNYGHAPTIDVDSMVASVRGGLRQLPSIVDELFVSPAGSMLDLVEVPSEARRQILELLAKHPAGRISMEARAETVTPEVAEELAHAFTNKTVSVGIGLESSSQWVLKYCVNKLSLIERFRSATEALRENGVGVYANISLGSAFLSPSEAISDAVQSVRWSLDAGSRIALIFPMHVKRYTLLDWLYSRGAYEPPSLWSLIEVLARTPVEVLGRVNISWYRSDYGDQRDIVASPTTCPTCAPQIFMLLDRYREQPGPVALGALTSARCACRDRWMARLEDASARPLEVRVFDGYKEMADELDLDGWWSVHVDGIRAELLRSRSNAGTPID